MTSNRSRFRRPVRFDRTRANPMQRLPFYRRSHAKSGDYWRMPTAGGFLMGREIGRVCSVAFVQALEEAITGGTFATSAHLADVVCSAIEASNGVVTDSQRGLVEGFFGRGSTLCCLLYKGVRASQTDVPKYTMQQLEDALTDLSSVGAEEYALRRANPVQAIIPDRDDHPNFELR